ncbi:MAG: YdcF family protein, partial [Kiritimatiellae bacterium]|nr:YdcF family protein [Kiritimatiellia bacterium]
HRMMEGVRLHRALPGSQLFVSVRRPNDPAEARRCLMELAVLTGLSSDQVEPIVGASTTKDEARLARERIGTNEFYLVTSDWHMPRALLLFRQAGMNPIPAPAKEGGWARDGSFRASHLLPSAGNFQTTEQVMHEFLGLMWGEMRGAGTYCDH